MIVRYVLNLCDFSLQDYHIQYFKHNYNYVWIQHTLINHCTHQL